MAPVSNLDELSKNPTFILPYQFHPRNPTTLVELRMKKLSAMVRAKLGLEWAIPGKDD